MEEATGFRLLDSLIRYYVVKQLSPTRILHDQIKLLRCLNDLIELDDVWVPDELQDVDFSRHSLHITHILNLILLEYLHCHLHILSE